MPRLSPRLSALVVVAALAAGPATAEQPGSQAEGPGWLEQLITGLMGQMMQDAGPALENLERDFGELAQTLEPTMRNMAELVDDIGNYEPPERLENGDILIRRKAGAPPPPDLPEFVPMPKKGTPGAPEGDDRGFEPLIIGPDGEIEL